MFNFFKHPRETRDFQTIENHSELNPGDIILMRYPDTFNPISRFIGAGQTLKKTKGGHYDTTHVAIVINPPKESNIPETYIAHYIKEGLVKQLMTDYFERDGITDRPFIVYRHKVQSVRNEIAKQADQADTQNTSFKPFHVLKNLNSNSTYRKNNQPKDKIDYTKGSYCSRFAAEVLNNSIESNTLNLEHDIAPKTLESVLYQHEDFEMFNYSGVGNAFDLIEEVIKTECARMQKKLKNGEDNYQEKVNETLRVLKTYENSEKTYQNAFYFAKEIAPIFAKNVSNSYCLTTNSYSNLLKVCRKLTIFKRDLVVREPDQIIGEDFQPLGFNK